MNTSPSAVTLFPDRARVTRRGHTALEVGLRRLEIGDLPLALLPDSVRASGRGTAHAKLLGVSTQLEHFVETPAEAVHRWHRNAADQPFVYQRVTKKSP